jgi:uncharacterized protein involved in high-affinity Fe2+ transport
MWGFFPLNFVQCQNDNELWGLCAIARKTLAAVWVRAVDMHPRGTIMVGR